MTERRTIMAKEKRCIPILDIYLAAFLALHKQEPILCRQGTRVVFEFSGTQEILKLLELYNTNPSIWLLEYVGHLRRLRAMMIGMRGER
jgi:hypothetical protein